MTEGKGLFSHFTKAKVVDRNVKTTEKSLCSPVLAESLRTSYWIEPKISCFPSNDQSRAALPPKRSTVDRIALLNLLLQSRREHSRPLWIAYIDLRAAFDSVDRTALRLLLKSIGIPPKLIDMLKNLYTNTVSCERLDGALSDWFQFGS